MLYNINVMKLYNFQFNKLKVYKSLQCLESLHVCKIVNRMQLTIFKHNLQSKCYKIYNFTM